MLRPTTTCSKRKVPVYGLTEVRAGAADRWRTQFQSRVRVGTSCQPIFHPFGRLRHGRRTFANTAEPSIVSAPNRAALMVAFEASAQPCRCSGRFRRLRRTIFSPRRRLQRCGGETLTSAAHFEPAEMASSPRPHLLNLRRWRAYLGRTFRTCGDGKLTSAAPFEPAETASFPRLHTLNLRRWQAHLGCTL